jgi:hypothetical protein
MALSRRQRKSVSSARLACAAPGKTRTAASLAASEQRSDKTSRTFANSSGRYSSEARE